MSGVGQYSAFADVAIYEALRTPWVDLGGALSLVSPIDLGIKVGREVLARAGIDPLAVDSVLAGTRQALLAAADAPANGRGRFDVRWQQVSAEMTGLGLPAA